MYSVEYVLSQFAINRNKFYQILASLTKIYERDSKLNSSIDVFQGF